MKLGYCLGCKRFRFILVPKEGYDGTCPECYDRKVEDAKSNHRGSKDPVRSSKGSGRKCVGSEGYRRYRPSEAHGRGTCRPSLRA